MEKICLEDHRWCALNEWNPSFPRHNKNRNSASILRKWNHVAGLDWIVLAKWNSTLWHKVNNIWTNKVHRSASDIAFGVHNLCKYLWNIPPSIQQAAVSIENCELANTLWLTTCSISISPRVKTKQNLQKRVRASFDMFICQTET